MIFIIPTFTEEKIIEKTLSALKKSLALPHEIVVSDGASTDVFQRLAKIGRTSYDSRILVHHTGRRAHKIGWPELPWQWTVNTVWFALFNRAHSSEWTVVR